MDITLIERMKALSSAEEFLDFFGVSFDAKVVHVNRLHILKRFYQYLHRAEGLAGLDDVAMFRRYRELLTQSYQDFVQSSAAKEKVFKVFQDADGQQHVSVDSLRASLSDRRKPAAGPGLHVA
ncbi:MAG: nitrogenase stabilizing/protective protein NifW [Leptothrix sp. (in: b-proteobacteria)]